MIVAIDTQLTIGTATGAGVYAGDLSSALEAAGTHVRALQAGWLDPWRFDRRVLWDQVLLPLAAMRSGAHVLHATAGTLPFVRTLPTIVTVHDMAWLRVQGHTRAYARAYFGDAMRRAYRTAALVVVDSLFSRAEYAELADDPRPATVVYPGVDARFARTERRPDAQPFVLVVGTLERRKNLVRAIHAVAAVPGLRLVAVGPFTAYANEARSAIEALGCSERVELRGYVDRATIDDLYARAACALVPSRYEGFGYAVAEARCAGVPFIAAHSSSLVEIAGAGATLVDPDDASGWIDALRALVRDRDAAERRAALDRPQAIARFSWAETARTFGQLYAQIAP